MKKTSHPVRSWSGLIAHRQDERFTGRLLLVVMLVLMLLLPMPQTALGEDVPRIHPSYSGILEHVVLEHLLVEHIVVVNHSELPGYR